MTLRGDGTIVPKASLQDKIEFCVEIADVRRQISDECTLANSIK